MVDWHQVPARRRFRLLPFLWRAFLLLTVTTFVVQLWVGLRGVPRWPREWLTGADLVDDTPPSYVVVLGGGGIPSESGLIRTYYGAQFTDNDPLPTFVVALPTDKDPATSGVGRMRDELVMRGVPVESVLMESRGVNTHFQAEEVRALLGDASLNAPVAVVTSPSHVRRSVMCFQKAGFENVYCCRADAVYAEADMGEGVGLRYGFWSNLETLVRYVRELVAIAYYKVRGWV